MLKSISVQNFMGIRGLLSVDTTVRVINGYPGSGKSSLCFAMVDPINHLSMHENRRPLNGRDVPYKNVYSKQELAKFRFQYDFDGAKVYYGYGKSNKNSIVWEELQINDEVVLKIDRRVSHNAEINLPGAETLRTNLEMNQAISLVRYVHGNALLEKESEVTKIFYKFFDFNENIYLSSPAYFMDSVRSENSYVLRNTAKYIYQNELCEQLNQFFDVLGMKTTLTVQEEWGNPVIKVCEGEDNSYSAHFLLTESEIMLIDVFVGIHQSEKCSLVIFDDVSRIAGAELAEKLEQYIINNCKSQVVLTNVSNDINNLNRIEVKNSKEED